MGEITKIELCNHTFNPWIGCSKVSAGCANCYAEANMGIRWGKVKWGPSGTRGRGAPRKAGDENGHVRARAAGLWVMLG